jgi:hypothetical protein
MIRAGSSHDVSTVENSGDAALISDQNDLAPVGVRPPTT